MGVAGAAASGPLRSFALRQSSSGERAGNLPRTDASATAQWHIWGRHLERGRPARSAFAVTLKLCKFGEASPESREARNLRGAATAANSCAYY